MATIERRVVRLKFAPEYVEPILAGEKTATIRWNDEKNIAAGDVLECVRADNGDVFTHRDVKVTTHTRVVDALQAVEDFHGRHTAGDSRSLLESLNDAYGANLTMGSRVKVILFDPPEG